MRLQAKNIKQHPESRRNIGIVATEFQPMVGGMEQHAFGLAKALAKTDDVRIFTHLRNAAAVNSSLFPVFPVLTGKLWQDRNILAREKVDLWLTLNAGYAPLSNMLDAPIYAYCHGNDFLQPWIWQTWAMIVPRILNKLPYLSRFSPWLSRQINHKHLFDGLLTASKVFVNSNFTKRTLLATFPGLARPIIVSNPGVNDHFFTNLPPPPPPGPGNDSKKLRLLTIARLSKDAPKKNVANVLRAVALLKNEIPINYQIIGDGNSRAELERLTRQLGIVDQVRFTGNLPNEKIPSQIDNVDFFVLPSWGGKYDVESFGIVYAEAAARGVPSLISRLGGATDAVVDGRTGIIIDGAGPEDIVAGIRRFWQIRHTFNSEDIREFAEQFCWSVVADKLRNDILTNFFEKEDDARAGTAHLSDG